MVSEEALTLLWDPGSLIGALEVKPVEIERLESSTRLKLQLVVAPELSLRCNFFKFLPVPAVGVLSENPERVAEMVIGALLLIVKCSQASATDFIYLDWHFSQGNSCNDQRCFQLRSHRLSEAPVKIASQIQSTTLEPLNLSPEPAPAATTTGSGAVFSLEVAPEEHETSSGRLGDDLGDLRRQKNVPGAKTGDALPPLDDQRRKNVHHLPGDGFRRESLNLGDAVPRADDHRPEVNGLPRSGVTLPRAVDDRRQENAFLRSGLELNDSLRKGDDFRGKGNAFLHSGLRMNDTLPKDDDLQGGFPRSGVKLADALPKAGQENRRQENPFLCSGLGLNDPLPKPDEHLRQENAFLRSGLGLNNPLPKPDHHLRQDNDSLLSGMGLNDSLPKSDDHLRQKNAFLRSELGLNDGLPKTFLRSGLKPGDRFAKADDHRSGSKPGDPLPKADDHRRQSSRSGAKLADPFDDHQLQSNGFSGMRFDDASPNAEDHQHEKPVSTRGVNKANGASSPSTCSAIFVANISLVNKQGLTSRRSTYQKVLSFEKNGAQVIERELRLPIDLILSPRECLVFYTPERLGLQGQAWSSEAVSSCIVSIIDNEMKAISFGFQLCFMVFEGDRKFISAVLEDLDTIYVAAVGLNIHAQCFVASSPGETEEVVSRCLKQAQGSFNFNSSGCSSALRRMAESQTVAEAFLTQSPAINPLTAHAILSSGKPLSTFISMQTMEQLQACRPFIVSQRSLELFKAQCEYGMGETAQKRAHLQNQEHLGLKKALETEKKRASAGESLKRRQQTLESEKRRAFAGESLKRRQQTLDDVLPTQSTSKQIFTQRFEFEEVQGPEQDGFSPEEEQQVEVSAPYFPPAAELNEEWSPEMKFSSGLYFPPAAQLDEVWDESPAVAEQQQQQQQQAGISSFDYFSEKNFESENEFGFSSNNRRQSSSSSSVKDALKSWLSTREKNKQSLKKPPLEEQRSINMNNNNNMQMPGLGNSGRKREAAAPLLKEEGNKGSRKKQQQQVKKNDILSLWENFKCRKQAQIQASGSLLQTSRSFKRPSSSIFSSSSSSPQREQQPQKSFSSVAQQPRGGKRTKRITL